MTSVNLIRAGAFSGLLVAASPALAVTNLLVNGDFSAGNVDFTSSYTYVVPAYVSGQGPWHGGLYTITPASSVGSASEYGNGWSVPSLAGNVLLANGASTQYSNVATPGSSVWSEMVSVSAHTNYVFSFYVVAVDGATYADLQPTITGTQGVGLTAEQGTWQQGMMSWNSGTNTTATLSLADLNSVEFNNDFALADLSLTGGVPEPSTWAMTLLGFAGLGFMSFRGSRKTAIA